MEDQDRRERLNEDVLCCFDGNTGLGGNGELDMLRMRNVRESILDSADSVGLPKNTQVSITASKRK